MSASTLSRIPTAHNLALASLIACANLGALLIAPFFHGIPAAALVLATLAALASPTHWALIHEAIHGLLLPGRVANERLARVLAILFGAPFRAVRFAHLRHHRYNRSVAGREEVYDPALQSRVAAFACITCASRAVSMSASSRCRLSAGCHDQCCGVISRSSVPIFATAVAA